MYEIIKNEILKGNYELKDVLYKINRMWIENAITEKEKEELEQIARENAEASNSYASVQEQFKGIWKVIEEHNVRLDALDGQKEPEIEYPEYKQPLGAHDAYKIGDKVTYKGKKYECVLNNCVWSPEEYPSAWKEVKQ